MTSAAAPAVSGADSLVPPVCCDRAGWPARSAHSLYIAVSVEHSAQLSSPGATSEMVEPSCGKPLELSELMLLSSQPVTPGNWAPP